MTESALDRRVVIRKLLADRGEMLVVSGLGGTTWDVASVGDDPLNFYVWGGMGGAASMGLGLALAQPDRRVLVVTGDGEMLMGIGSLATIALKAPANLAVVVIDNERYGETGMQETHTAHGVDLAGFATAAGIPTALTVSDSAGLDDLAAKLGDLKGPLFATVKVTNNQGPMILPPRDAAYVKNRFRVALLGEQAAMR
ncbi:MAG: aldehyde dehydrogenase [Rhodospirillaceae bacterium]|nr:aldehyde dehydrogenase [Rhodospirillaceae bacterium]